MQLSLGRVTSTVFADLEVLDEAGLFEEHRKGHCGKVE